MHNIIQSLSQKSSSFEIQLQNIVENSTKTSEYFSDINNKFQTLNVKMDKRGRRLKKQKKKQLGVEKYAQTEYNLFIKPGNYKFYLNQIFFTSKLFKLNYQFFKLFLPFCQNRNITWQLP